MTVETTARKATFAGGQDTNEFTFRALVSAPADIKVLKTLTSTGVDTDLAYSTDYTVSINTDGIGGIVTLTPSVSTLYTTTVYRETTNTQASDYDDYNQFPADTLETDLDKRTMIDQEQAEALERTLRYPISASGASTELPTPEADSFLAWNSAGDGLENKAIPDPSTLVKASSAEAQAGTEDTHYMTPSKTAEAISALTTFEMASQEEAEAGVENTKYMSALRVKQAILNIVFPVGTVLTLGVSTNPATLFGVGTWTAIKGQVVVGIDVDVPSFATLNLTGGSLTHTITTAELPTSIWHSAVSIQSNAVAGSGYKALQSDGAACGGGSMSVLQPYRVKYVWERTA